MALMRNNSAYQNVTLRNKGEDVMETSALFRSGVSNLFQVMFLLWLTEIRYH